VVTRAYPVRFWNKRPLPLPSKRRKRNKSVVSAKAIQSAHCLTLANKQYYTSRTLQIVVCQSPSLEGRLGRGIVGTPHSGVATELFEFVHHAASNRTRTGHFPSHAVANHKNDILALGDAAQRARNLFNETFTEQETLTAVASAEGEPRSAIATGLLFALLFDVAPIRSGKRGEWTGPNSVLQS
jgi:hypothetical protein